MSETSATGAGTDDPAFTDELTGLRNRRGFFRLAARRFAAARRRRDLFTAAFIDLDNLQEINEALSREAGSAMIREVAELVSLSCEPDDVIGRIGGKELAVCAQIPADELRERIAATVADANERPERPYLISVSVGAVTATAGERATLDGLIAAAAREMFEERRRRGAGAPEFAPRVRVGRTASA